jgi:hypothetical protein
MDGFLLVTGIVSGHAKDGWAGPGASKMLVSCVEEPVTTMVAAGPVGLHDAPGALWIGEPPH